MLHWFHSNVLGNMSSEIGAMQAISLWAENERNSVQTKPTGNASSRPYRVKRICATYRTALLIPFSLSLFPYYPPLLSCSLPPEYTTPAPERRNRLEKNYGGCNANDSFTPTRSSALCSWIAHRGRQWNHNAAAWIVDRDASHMRVQLLGGNLNSSWNPHDPRTVVIRAGGQALLLPGRRDQGTPSKSESAAFGSGRRRAVVSPGAIHQIHTCISRKKHPLPEGDF